MLSYLADAAWLTGHRDAAALVAELLEPHAGLLVYVPGIACYGSADRYLGRVAEVLGRRSAARSHLEEALSVDRRTGWDVWIAHSSLALGQHLWRMGSSAERARAERIVADAATIANALGMATLAQRCAAARASAPGGAMGPVAAAVIDDRGLTPKEHEVLALLALGRSNRQIGLELHSSMHTVANHVRAILAKTGCANRTEAAGWAHDRGLAR